jgi:hypothetical protein
MTDAPPPLRAPARLAAHLRLAETGNSQTAGRRRAMAVDPSAPLRVNPAGKVVPLF